MLSIADKKVKPRRRVTYKSETPNQQPVSWSDRLRQHNKDEEKRKRELEDRFFRNLRNTASSWVYIYKD